MAIQSEYSRDKAAEQVMKIALEDGEDILGCIHKAAEESGLNEFRVSEMSGFWKEGFMNYFEGNRFKSRKSFDVERLSAGSGKFIRQGDGKYAGDLHIAVTLGAKKINGTLLKGKAAKELTVKIKFLKFA
ncbi:MAG: hypothetical protein V1676_07475 [Candidatus Diapherotrites archaeon]